MKIVITALLIALSVALSYMLVESVRVPVEFKNTREARNKVVHDQLKELAELQKMYNTIKGHYAGSFDSLQHVLLTDSFMVEQVIGDPNDTTKAVERHLIKISARDSMMGFLKKSVLKDSVADLEKYFLAVRTVPFSSGKPFEIQADSAVISAGLGETRKTPTFEVRTKFRVYLPEYDSAYMRYDQFFDPVKVVKVGDLTKPTTNGNW